MAIGAGTIVMGKIVLERELGRGGMGVVWVGENRELNSSVVVKVLHSGAATPDARARFAREAKAVARIDSPHVIRVFDAGTTAEGDPFIVMELLRGRDLKAHLAASRTLSLEETSSLLHQICAAIGRAHGALGVLHRDIKPANVFLVEGGVGTFVKVLDFGIAKALDEVDSSLTVTQALVGTPPYMSPEQLLDPRKIDSRADLWSVAVLAYQCLTGALPFHGETVGAMALAVHAGTFMRVGAIRPDLPPSIDAWFARALDPDRERRFQSAAELAGAFPSARALATSATNATSCPDENALLDLVDGRLGEEARHRLRSHAGSCPSCGPAVAGFESTAAGRGMLGVTTQGPVVVEPGPGVLVDRTSSKQVVDLEAARPLAAMTTVAVVERPRPRKRLVAAIGLGVVLLGAGVVVAAVLVTAQPSGKKTRTSAGASASSIADSVPAPLARGPSAPVAIECAEGSPVSSSSAGVIVGCLLAADVQAGDLRCQRMSQVTRFPSGRLKHCTLAAPVVHGGVRCAADGRVELHPTGDIATCRVDDLALADGHHCRGDVELFLNGKVKRCKLSADSALPGGSTAPGASWINLLENGRIVRVEYPTGRELVHGERRCKNVTFHEDGAVKMCSVADGLLFYSQYCFDPAGNPTGC